MQTNRSYYLTYSAWQDYTSLIYKLRHDADSFKSKHLPNLWPQAHEKSLDAGRIHRKDGKAYNCYGPVATLDSGPGDLKAAGSSLLQSCLAEDVKLAVKRTESADSDFEHKVQGGSVLVGLKPFVQNWLDDHLKRIEPDPNALESIRRVDLPDSAFTGRITPHFTLAVPGNALAPEINSFVVVLSSSTEAGAARVTEKGKDEGSVDRGAESQGAISQAPTDPLTSAASRLLAEYSQNLDTLLAFQTDCFEDKHKWDLDFQPATIKVPIQIQLDQSSDGTSVPVQVSTEGTLSLDLTLHQTPPSRVLDALNSSFPNTEWPKWGLDDPLKLLQELCDLERAKKIIGAEAILSVASKSK